MISYRPALLQRIHALFGLVVLIGLGSHVGGNEPSVGPIRVLSFSPNGTAVAIGSGEKDKAGFLTLIDSGTGNALWQHREDRGVVAVSFHPDGKSLAIAAYGRSAQLLNAATGKPTAAWGDYAKEVRSVAFSPDGKLLATAVWDGSVRLWDVGAGVERATLSGHPNQILDVAFSPDGRRLASAGTDAVRLWDVAEGQAIGLLALGGYSTKSVRFTPDGRSLFAGGLNDGTTVMWTIESAEVRAKFRGGLDGVALTGAGRGVLACGWGRTIHLYEQAWAEPTAAEADQIRVLLGKLDDDSYAVREEASRELSKVGLVAEAELRRVSKEPPSPEVRIRARRLRHDLMNQPTAIFSHPSEEVGAMAFSPDGKRLATGSKDGIVILWDVAGRKEAARWKVPKAEP